MFRFGLLAPRGLTRIQRMLFANPQKPPHKPAMKQQPSKTSAPKSDSPYSSQKPKTKPTGAPQKPSATIQTGGQKPNTKVILGILAAGAAVGYYFASLHSKSSGPNIVLKKPVQETPANQEVEIFKTKADLKDGEKRAFQVGPKPEDAVLIIKQNGKYYCVQDQCSHFGFSLAKGMLFGEQIVCPLHNATFSIVSGEAETGPIFNGLQTYKIREQNGELTIQIPKGKLNSNKVIPMATKLPEDNFRIVVIGGGPAALSAAETLRQCGYTGHITLISKDSSLPYDRTALSKNFNAKPDGTIVRKGDFLQKYGIDVKTGRSVVGVNYSNKSVLLDDNNSIIYDKLLIATGCETHVPPIPGADKIKNLTLRNHEDLEHIREAIQSGKKKNVTIIGAGFIGVELSSALKMELKDKVNVTLVEGAKTPFERVFGEQVGKSLQSFIEKNGVKVLTGAKVKEIKSDKDQVKSVQIEGRSIPTDVVVFATGVKPVTYFLGDIKLDSKNGGVETNSYLKTSRDDVYAAGDVASFPYWLNASNCRVEHYNEAIYQGSIAALNMIGKHRAVDNVPFFWTRFFNTSVQYTGNTSSWDDIIVKGNLAEQKFVAYYVSKGKVVAAAAMNSLNSIMIIKEALQQGVMPSAQEINKSDWNLESLTGAINQKSPLCKKCRTIQGDTK